MDAGDASQPTDQALAEAAKAGSSRAFSELVLRHQAAVRGFLRRVCADPSEADDMAQEALVTAWTKIGTLKPDASVRSWFCGLAWRKAMTTQRGRARSAARDRQWLETRPEFDTPAARDQIAVRKALDNLPEDQRAVVALCLAGDWSHAEAAEALGLPLGTVKSHAARGRAKLLEAMGEAP
ncbi:RNA polymerase sigma factor [Brevundimonas aveniformis]|uniref:RNA polymerase sigma factor n=1 Tax=Brevundimonas aveniformis TaxID=370977 RepID=UPI002492C387|nr:RNA polymerase sigma factor [Brevundimonas aveniformis]